MTQAITTLTIIFLMIYNLSKAQSNPQISDVFTEFQNGYSKRDTTVVDRFANHLFAKDIFILGTGADEWIEGIEAAKQLVKNDWLYWMNLRIDTTSLKLTIKTNTALFALNGTTSINFPSKDAAYDFAYTRLKQTSEAQKTNKEKVLAYAKEASELMREIERGELNIKYNIRVAGALVKQNNKWLFSQLIFSFPYPMVRE